MSDVFPEKRRALVMAIFNWGIYGGYGIAFPVGRYITKLNIWDLVSILWILMSTMNMKASQSACNLIIKIYRLGMAYLLLWYRCFGRCCCSFYGNNIERARAPSNWREHQSKQSQKGFTFQSAHATTHHSFGNRCINSSLWWHDIRIQCWFILPNILPWCWFRMVVVRCHHWNR